MPRGGDVLSEMASLIEPHIPALRRFAWSLLRDETRADDLVQDCLERIVSRWHLRRREGNLKAWSMTILYNLFVNQHHAQQRRGQAVQIEDWDGAPQGYTASEAEQRLVVRDVMAGLAELPDELQAVLLLVGVEDLSYGEAAKVLGVPVGTVMSRLSRARQLLRERVEGRPKLRRVV
jgi:RNA polymerase sigma-70 factor, ECF subfamily